MARPQCRSPTARASGRASGSGCSSSAAARRRAAAPGCSSPSGRTWEFPTVGAAARFVRRWGDSETLGGELRGLWPGGDHPPRPTSTYKEGGAYAEATAALGGPALTRAEVRAELGAVMGRRLQPGGRVTWYDRFDGETAGRLGLVLAALERHDAGEVAIEITTVQGRATELRLRAAARIHGDLALAGPAAGVRDLVKNLRGSGVRSRAATDAGVEAELVARPHRPRQPRARCEASSR